MDWSVMMACRSIWWGGLVCAGLVNSPALADAGHDKRSVVLILVANYQLPSHTVLALVPATTSVVPEYGALAELNTSAAIAMATANRTRAIPGPDLNYRAGQRGPLLEIAALGGGMDSAPFLAHVGLDWIF